MPFSRISFSSFGLVIISQLFFIKFKKFNFKLRANVSQTRASSSLYSTNYTWDQIDGIQLLTSPNEQQGRIAGVSLFSECDIALTVPALIYANLPRRPEAWKRDGI
jgi:hypothetical protein